MQFHNLAHPNSISPPHGLTNPFTKPPANHKSIHHEFQLHSKPAAARASLHTVPSTTDAHRCWLIDPRRHRARALCSPCLCTSSSTVDSRSDPVLNDAVSNPIFPCVATRSPNSSPSSL
ncbi:hypothetical protein M0R45_027148 [Rubus argutus]|uniref:Uncharacterized protein n=1 Tax=Rubus argutus TaxID=59490 RepID=A0AAW1WZQ2_RUBAR